MKQMLRTPNDILKILEPTERGVLGLVDDFLELCRDDGVQLDWQAERCRVRYLDDSTLEPFEAPLPKSVFRAFLARIAALCNEHRPNSVSPYGGQGELSVGAEPPVLFRATFTNTRAEQKLVLTRVTPTLTSANPQ